MKSIYTLLLLSLISASCSMAPVNGPTTAASLKKGEYQVDANVFIPGVALNYGLTEKLDLNAAYEIQGGHEFSASAKYSLVNHQEGLSFALWAGAFQALDWSSSYGYFAGPIISYKNGWFETFLRVGYNYVHWNGYETDGNTNNWLVDFLEEDISFQYLQTVLGVNFWFNKNTGMSINANYFYIDSGEASATISPNLNFMFKF